MFDWFPPPMVFLCFVAFFFGCDALMEHQGLSFGIGSAAAPAASQTVINTYVKRNTVTVNNTVTLKACVLVALPLLQSHPQKMFGNFQNQLPAAINNSALYSHCSIPKVVHNINASGKRANMPPGRRPPLDGGISNRGLKFKFASNFGTLSNTQRAFIIESLACKWTNLHELLTHLLANCPSMQLRLHHIGMPFLYKICEYCLVPIHSCMGFANWIFWTPPGCPSVVQTITYHPFPSIWSNASPGNSVPCSTLLSILRAIEHSGMCILARDLEGPWKEPILPVVGVKCCEHTPAPLNYRWANAFPFKTSEGSCLGADPPTGLFNGQDVTSHVDTPFNITLTFHDPLHSLPLYDITLGTILEKWECVPLSHLAGLPQTKAQGSNAGPCEAPAGFTFPVGSMVLPPCPIQQLTHLLFLTQEYHSANQGPCEITQGYPIPVFFYSPLVPYCIPLTMHPLSATVKFVLRLSKGPGPQPSLNPRVPRRGTTAKPNIKGAGLWLAQSALLLVWRDHRSQWWRLQITYLWNGR